MQSHARRRTQLPRNGEALFEPRRKRRRHEEELDVWNAALPGSRVRSRLRRLAAKGFFFSWGGFLFLIFCSQHGANVDAHSGSGETPLILAVHNNKQNEVLQLLDAGANPNAKTEKGQTALFFATGECF